MVGRFDELSILVKFQGSLFLSLKGIDLFDTTSRSPVEALVRVAFFTPGTVRLDGFQGSCSSACFSNGMEHDMLWLHALGLGPKDSAGFWRTMS